MVGGGPPSRRRLYEFDQNATRQDVQQGDNAERGNTLKLAVSVMMFLVGGPVGNTDHQPGDNGGDHIYRAVQRLGDQRQAADSNADHKLGGSHPGARKDGNRRYAGFVVMNVIAHGCGFSSPAINIKAPIGSAMPPVFVAN